MNTKERRLKIVMMTEDFVRHFLDIGAGNDNGAVLVPKLRGLPDGYKIHRVWHDMRWLALCVMVSHPSFEAVPDGHEIPGFDGAFGYVAEPVELRTLANDATKNSCDRMQGKFETMMRENAAYLDAAWKELGEFHVPGRPLAECIADMRKSLEAYKNFPPALEDKTTEVHPDAEQWTPGRKYL